MDREDDLALAAFAAAEMVAEQAGLERSARKRRMRFATLASLGLLSSVACALYGYIADGEGGQTVTVLGRADHDVRVEVEGRAPMIVQARGGVSFRFSAPGPRRFRFEDVETGDSFERVYDVPQKVRGEDFRLAVPTEEDRCYALLDVDAWYGEAQSLTESLRLDPGSQAGSDEAVPLPHLISRIRPLDRIPVNGYGRNLSLTRTIGADSLAMSLVDLSCADLELDDDDLVLRALALHGENAAH